AREDAREGRDRAREPHDSGESREERGAAVGGAAAGGAAAGGAASGDEGGAASGGAGPGPEAARRVHEQARRLREEARRARDEAMGGRLGDPVGAGFHAGDRDWDAPGGAGWGQGPGWTDWPGRRGWEDWARMRGRHGWPGGLDFGTLRDLERVAVQFTSDLRRVAMQSSSSGENVISDLRTILEDALERIKSEIFGSGAGSGSDPGHEAPGQKGTDTAEPAGTSGTSG